MTAAKVISHDQVLVFGALFWYSPRTVQEYKGRESGLFGPFLSFSTFLQTAAADEERKKNKFAFFSQPTMATFGTFNLDVIQGANFILSYVLQV